MNPVVPVARSRRLDENPVAVLGRVDDQRFRGLRVRPAPLDLDEDLVAVPRLQLNGTVEGPNIQIRRAGEGEPFLLPGHDPFAANVDAAGGGPESQNRNAQD